MATDATARIVMCGENGTRDGRTTGRAEQREGEAPAEPRFAIDRRTSKIECEERKVETRGLEPLTPGLQSLWLIATNDGKH